MEYPKLKASELTSTCAQERDTVVGTVVQSPIRDGRCLFHLHCTLVSCMATDFRKVS